jgi:hypothetical protein
VVNLREIARIDFQSLEVQLHTSQALPFEEWRSTSLMNKYNELARV